MTPEEVKKQLGQYRKIRDECERLRGRIENKRKDMLYLQAVIADGTVRGGSVSNSVERAIEQTDVLIGYYAKRVAVREASELQALRMIESVDEPDGRSILFLHYIEGRRFEEIPDELHIANGTMWKYYKAALKKCSEME